MRGRLRVLVRVALLPGMNYLVPAFTAAFLNATSIARGRFNPWGSTIAVYFLVTGITGFSILGHRHLRGGALVLALTFSHRQARRQTSEREQLQVGSLAS